MSVGVTDGKLQGKTIDYIELKQTDDGLTTKLRVLCKDQSTLDVTAAKSVPMEDVLVPADPFLVVVTTLAKESTTIPGLEPLDIEGMIKELEDPDVREALYVNSAFMYPDIDYLIAILKLHNI